jgi:hypothetical protein
MTGRPINSDRANAIAFNLKTYTGAQHWKCGTTERYVSGGGCVHCARELATMQREALKALKAARAADLDEKIEDQIVNHDPEEPLDSPEPDAYERSIEDML